MKQCKINNGNIELFLSAYMGLKSFTKYELLSHLLIYSNTTEHSDKIIEYIEILLDSNFFDINKNMLYRKSLHSNIKKDINYEINEFKKYKYGIITCVYIFGEGFDEPKINGVLFSENMLSETRIIQSATRCLRLDKENPEKRGYMIIPYLDKDEWNDENESFKKLRNIVYQIRNEDKNIEHRIKYTNVVNTLPCLLKKAFTIWKNKINKRNDKSYDYDEWIDDDENGLNKLKLRLRKSNTLKKKYESENQEHYEYMKERNRGYNLSDKKEYLESIQKPDYIENPEKYFELYWENWYLFLGVDTSVFIQDKDEWIIECKKNNFKSFDDYKLLCEKDDKFPKSPGEFYQNYSNFNNELGISNGRRKRY